MLDDLQKTLWATADKLRANMDAAEYKHLVLGLIFVKYISDIQRIADTVAAWRGEPASRPLPQAGEGRGEGLPAPVPYTDIPGFCRSVPLHQWLDLHPKGKTP